MFFGGVEKCPLFTPTTLHFLGPQRRTIYLSNFRALRKVYVARPLGENTQNIVCGHEMMRKTTTRLTAWQVFYLGINDCGRMPSDDLEPIVEAVFDVLHNLYTKFFARNFVLIDVPPIDRSPGGMINSNVSASIQAESSNLYGPSH